MEMEIIRVIIPVVFFATVFGMFYIFITTRNKERMSMIEKGFDASLFNQPAKRTTTFLKIGILSIGLSIGIFIGNLLEDAGIENSMAPLVILFSGVSFILAFFIDKKFQDQEKK